MRERGIGDNGGPPIAIRNFKRKWAEAIFAQPEKPAGAVAMAFKIYTSMDANGCGVVISDREFMESCGVSDGACRTFKKWLVKHSFIEIEVHGRRGVTSRFRATLPAGAAGYSELDSQQPMPANETRQPATTAGYSDLPAGAAGYPPPRARAEVSNINNNNNNLASVEDNSPREAGSLAVLNGAKAMIVDQLAAWLSPFSPDTETAEKWLVTATTMHGGMVVKEAFGELQAQIASGDVIGRPIVVLNRICERIKKTPRKHTAAPTASDAKRQIDAIVGRRS